MQNDIDSLALDCELSMIFAEQELSDLATDLLNAEFDRINEEMRHTNLCMCVGCIGR